MTITRRTNLRPYYAWTISLVGLTFAVWGIWLSPTYYSILDFVLLVMLAAISEVAATYVKIGAADMAYEVGTAVSMAAIPLFGPAAAATAVAVSGFAFWLATQRNNPQSVSSYKKVESLLFNAGMHSVAIYIAGTVFVLIQGSLNGSPVLADLIPWLPAAIIYDQTNLWLVIGMIWLASSNPPKPLDFWRENRWAMVINIAVLSIGGALLTFAVQAFGWIGIVIFFIPIALSSLAFRLYVRQMQAHMNNLENIIAERTEELKTLMREKDAFLAVLTHDMKSPLTTIGIYAGLLQERPNLLLERPYITNTLRQSQESLLGIVNNILDLEKLQTGGISLSKEYFDLALLIDAVIAMLKIQADQKEVQMAYHPQMRSLNFFADKNQVERILHNLISNAIKYTPEGESIEIKLSNSAETAVIDIIDTGLGIPEQELPYVFERFRRVDKHKKMAAGTGLGLAITKALVEAHDGQISVSSEEGKGSHFTVKLPIHH